MAEMNVQLVSAERAVWSGTATIVIARTLDGDIGLLPGHTPLFGTLADGVVTIRGGDGETVVAAVYGGFLSVENNMVSILAEDAELATEIDVAKAREELEAFAVKGGDATDEEWSAAQRRAETRLQAAEGHL